MKNPLTIHSDSSENLHYNIEHFPLYTRKDELYRYDYQALIHWHPDLEFIYIEKGTMDYYINGKIVRMSEGNGIFVNSQRLHYGFSHEHNECTFIALVISPDIFTKITPFAKEYMSKKFGLKNTDYIPLYKHVEWEKNILNLIMSIHDEMHHKHLRPLLVISQALAIVDMIGEHIDDYKENNHNSYDQDLFLKMTAYICQHLDEKITIDMLSQKVGISRNKCCELFQRFTKNTVLNYLIHYRLNKSMDYLRNTHLSILEISQMCGFSSPSYFTSVFKKEMGMTPKQYRFQIKEYMSDD